MIKKINKITSTLMAVLIFLVSMLAPSAFAAQDLEECASAIDFVGYYNESEETIESTNYVGFGAKSNETIVLFTSAPNNGSVWTYGEDEGSTFVFESNNGGQLQGDVYMYINEADSNASLGTENGFIEMGTVNKGERCTILYVTQEDDKYYIEPLECSVVSIKESEGIVRSSTLSEYPENVCGPAMILNSSFLICGYLGNDGVAYVFAEDGASGSGSSSSSSEKSTETQKIKKADNLPEINKIIEEPDSQPSLTIILLCTIPGVIALIVLVTFLILYNKKKHRLEPVEEGTRLAYNPVDTGLYLKFSNGRQLRLNQNVTIGRGANNTVVISPNTAIISGHHCEVVVENRGAYLRDTSRNGCYINNVRVSNSQQIELRKGTRVYLGQPNSPEYFDVL